MKSPEHQGFQGALLLDVPWQGHVMDVQELVWGGCKLGLLLTKVPQPRVDISLPCGVHTLHCHPSAVAAGLRSLLLRMDLPPSAVAACGPLVLHSAASNLGMQTFDIRAVSDVGWIVASSHRCMELPLVGVAMSTRRWRDFLQRGFFPCVPCSGVSFARCPVPANEEAQRLPFDILLHKASDFLERLDDSGRPILSEKFTALLSYASGAHERPVCLEGVSYLEKVTNRELMYATLQAKLKSPGITANACTPPYLKVSAGECMNAVGAQAQSLGMMLPLLVKPLPACSLPGAHEFQLVESLAGGATIKQDSIVQPVIPHDGPVYKVCVIGSQACVSERESSTSLSKVGASEEHSRSRAAGSIEQALAAHLKEAFHMKIFGFDLLLDMVTGEFNVVDVNHFPSLKDFPWAKEAICDLCKDFCNTVTRRHGLLSP